MAHRNQIPYEGLRETQNFDSFSLGLDVQYYVTRTPHNMYIVFKVSWDFYFSLSFSFLSTGLIDYERKISTKNFN